MIHYLDLISSDPAWFYLRASTCTFSVIVGGGFSSADHSLKVLCSSSKSIPTSPLQTQRKKGEDNISEFDPNNCTLFMTLLHVFDQDFTPWFDKNRNIILFKMQTRWRYELKRAEEFGTMLNRQEIFWGKTFLNCKCTSFLSTIEGSKALSWQ